MTVLRGITRAEVLASLRRFFAERGVHECWTSALCPAGGADAAIASFSVGSARLHTSPEFAMKRRIVARQALGLSGDIYQVATVFRRGEEGPLHRPCFSLLEWYRIDIDEMQLMSEVEAMVRFVARDVFEGRASGSGGQGSDDGWDGRVRWRGRSCSLDVPFSRLALAEQLRNAGVEVAPTCSEMGPSLVAALGRLGERTDLDPVASFDLLYHHLGTTWAGIDMPAFVSGFPIEHASLAALDDEAPLPARRFELVIAGVEVANGWAELRGRAANEARLRVENERRAALGIDSETLDEDFLEAVDALPRCAGVALGIDRLHLLLAGADDIGALEDLC